MQILNPFFSITLVMFRNFNIISTRIFIRWRYYRDFQILKETIRLGEKILQTKPVIWDESNNFSKIVLVTLAKNLSTMRAVDVLCSMGFAKDAVIFLRVMFENLVDFKWMQEDKKKVEDYIDYSYYLKLKLGKALLNSSAKNINKTRIRERNKELQEKWNKVKYKFTYLTKEGTRRKCRRWSCKNLKEMCEELDLKENRKRPNLIETYYYLYAYLSNYTHSTSLIANDYIIGLTKDKKNVRVEIGTSIMLIAESLPTASGIFLGILEIINDEYKMGFDTSLNNLFDRLKKKNKTNAR